MKTPFQISFEDVPESKIPEVDLNVFTSIVGHDHVVLVRGMYNDKWRTFIALAFDASTGEALSMKKAAELIPTMGAVTIKPVGMLFDSFGEDISNCKSADGKPVVFDDIQLNQKPS